MSAVPPKAINLRSADGSQLEILGYIRLMRTLGDIILPVDALVSPKLKPDKMLLDNSTRRVGMRSVTDAFEWSNSYLR